MSDVFTWDVSVIAPTSGSVAFQEHDVNIGTTIYADFTWSNASPGAAGYAFMEITDPNGAAVTVWLELSASTGDKTLSYVADMPGTWKAELKIWAGFEWMTLIDTMLVSGPYIVIDPASMFSTGPFIAQTMQVICDIHARNDGNAAAQVHIGLYAYPGTASESQIGYLFTGADVAPGGTVQQVFELIVPGEHAHTWPLGVKVWGAGEVEPSFGVGGTVGKAGVLSHSMKKRPMLESEAEAMFNDGK